MKKAGAPKAKKATNCYKMAAPMPEGLVVSDLKKAQWKIGSPIGSGGFGLIYLTQPATSAPVSKNAEFVMKIEPHENGPLFCETTFFQRVAKPEQVKEYMKQKSLKFLGVPNFASLGNHEKDGKKYRFMVIQRFQTDLQKIFEKNDRQLPHHSVFIIGLQMMDVLEFIHSQGYAHADIKAANIMIGSKNLNQAYLIDYGLAFRFLVDGKHKAYKEDPKMAHDGTAEFASRDAHKGVWPSARGDLEILGYCMWQWLCGSLPWERNIDDKNYVANQKIRYMSDISGLIGPLVKNNASSMGLCNYLTIIAKLKYDEKPNYDFLKNICKSTLTSLGCKNFEKLDLTCNVVTSTTSDVKKKSPVKKSPIKSRKRSFNMDHDSENDLEVAIKKSKKIPAPKNKSPDVKIKSPVAAPIKKFISNKSCNNNSNNALLKDKNVNSGSPVKNVKGIVASEGGSGGRKRCAPVNYKEVEDDVDDEILPKNKNKITTSSGGTTHKDHTPKLMKRIRKNVSMAEIATQTSPGLKGLPRSKKPINK